MNAHIGDRIREARQARGMSLRQLAGRVGIHYSHLSKVENGKDSVGRQTLVRIAEELGADSELMLGEAVSSRCRFACWAMWLPAFPLRPSRILRRSS